MKVATTRLHNKLTTCM